VPIVDIKANVSIRPSSSDLWFFSYLPLAIADGIATPLIPLLALQHFGAGAFAVTIIIAASGMSQVPFTILWGNLSDRVAHRKFFLVGSFFATGVSLILIALASDILTYFWLNVVEGLACAASAPIGTMLLLETRQKRWWPEDIGIFGLISGLGTTAGLGLGFVWLFVIGFSGSMVSVMTGLLILAGVLALLSAVIAWAWIEEPTVRLDRRSLADLVNLHRGALERVRRVRSRVLNIVDLTRSEAEPLPGREILFLLALGVMTVGFEMFYGPFPVFLTQVAAFSDASVFIVYLGAAAASTALFYHSGKAVELHSPKHVFMESLLGRLALILLFLWGPAYILFGLGSPGLVAWMTILNALLGVTWAFISTASTLFLVRLVGRSSRGRALGLYNAVAGAGGLLGTLLGGFCYATYGVHVAYGLAAFTVLVGLVLLAPIPYHVFTLPHAYRHHRFHTTRALAGFGRRRRLRTPVEVAPAGTAPSPVRPLEPL
jgi:MFS family permease